MTDIPEEKSQLTYQLEQQNLSRGGGDTRVLNEKLHKLTVDDPSHTPKTKPDAKRSKDRSHRKTLNGGGSTISPTSSNSSSPLFSREQPMIHNKLYCDTIVGNGNGNGNGSRPQRKVSTKVLSKLGNDDLRSVKSHTELAETVNGVRMLAKNLARATIQLDVKAIMIVTKARDNSLIYLTREVVEWFFNKDRDIVVYVDGSLKKSKRFDHESLRRIYPEKSSLLKFWDKKFAFKNPEKFDLVLTLGGDGTVLYVSNLFQRVVPPVISFALGSLGFLTNFQFEQFREKMSQVLESGVRAYLRMRFTCRVHKANGKLVCEQQVLNELVVDRGPSPFVTNLELYGDGSLLTVAQADGLIIATPTGSTAYSLSAGGSLVHPGVSAISVTPICPHTLSFRPILLPDGMFLKVKVPKTSRSTAWCSFDGKVRTELCKGDYVTIQASPFPFPTVISSKTDYIDSVSRNLNWNVREAQKPLGQYLSGTNREKLLATGQVVEDEDEFDIDYGDDENGSLSSSEEDEFDGHFLPEIGQELPTPPDPNIMEPFDFDDRPCYAHPNATISLNEPSHSSSRYSSSSTSVASDHPLTISAKQSLP